MASGGSENRGQKVGSMASGLSEPRQKGTLWLRFLTEAKSCALLASPQYVSVPESVQNMINNRCQRPFLHWCLFRLVASIVPDVRCINVFTHNSLRDKGDSLTTIVGHIKPYVLGKLDVVVGWEAAKNKNLIMISIFEEFRWMWCYVWFGIIDWILIKCYLNAVLNIIGHVLFRNFFYEYKCLCLAYPYLFVIVFVACAIIV